MITGTGGLRAYRAAGRSGFRLLDGRRVVLVGAAGQLAYLRVGGAASLTIVDLARGPALGTGPDPSPLPLTEDGRGPWE